MMSAPIRRTTARVAAGVLSLCLGGASVAACSSGSSSTTTSAPSVTSTSRARAGGTTSSTAGVVACATGELAGSINPRVLPPGAVPTGTHATTVALRNLSTRSCVLAGYPSLQLLDATGKKMTTRTVNGGRSSATDHPVAVVVIPSGQSGSFVVTYAAAPAGGGSCPPSASLQVTPPTNFDPLTVPVVLSPCNGGPLTVSPILSGADGVGGGTSVAH